MDDHEVLDWGNEEEDLKTQGVSRNYGYENGHPPGDSGDAEDAVSLGEEDDDRDYLISQSEELVSASDGNTSRDPGAASNTSSVQQTRSSSGLRHEESFSATHAQPSSAKTPRKNNNSRNHQSPQRSQPLRLTHALPPKPVAATVPFLRPSHPSIVEATAMSVNVTTRSSGRSTAKLASPTPDLDPLPPHWEIRIARSGKGESYYYNTRTEQSTWTRPVSSTSSPPRGDSTRRRGSYSLPPASKPLSPPHSDQAHHESQESSRHQHVQPLPDSDLTGPSQPTEASNNTELSYEDRHYRPSDSGNISLTSGYRRGDRSRVSDVDPRFNPHPDKMFTPSPPSRARELARSPSPVLLEPSNGSRSRDARSSHASRSVRSGRDVDTDADASIHRDHNVLQPPYTSHRSDWNQVDSGKRRGGDHHHHDRLDESSHEGLGFEERLPLPSSRESLRSRVRDQDQRQERETRDEDRSQNMSAPRTSPSHSRDSRAHNNDSIRNTHHRPHPPHELEQHEMAPHPQKSIPSPTQHRKRERPTRFGEPLASTPPLPAPSPTPNTRPTSYQNQPVEAEDPFLPDDLRSPPREFQAHGSGNLRDELTFSATSQQVAYSDNDAFVLSHGSGQRNRPIEDHSLHPDRSHSRSYAEQSRSSPSLEQPARRNRAPLPPQEAEFRGTSYRPREDRGRLANAPQDRSSPWPNRGESGQQRSNNHANGSNLPPRPHPQTPLHGRGINESQRSLNYGNPGSIQHPDRDTRRRDRRPPAIYPPSVSQNDLITDTDVSHHDLPPRPLPVSAREAEPGGYSNREDSGPQASTTTNSRSHRQRALSPSRLQDNHGATAGSRQFERSPPPHIGARAREGGRDPPSATRREAPSGWTEERNSYSSENGRRQIHDRPSNPHRPSFGPTSGSNSVPVGSKRAVAGDDASRGSSPLPIRITNDNSSDIGSAYPRSAQSSSTRGRGGPQREAYDWPQSYDDGSSYRPAGSEGDALFRKDRNPMPYEATQSLAVRTAVVREPDGFSGSPQLPPRTWAPRAATPPQETFHPGTSAGSDGRPPTSPPISRGSSHVSPSWEATGMGPLHPRYATSRMLERSEGSRNASIHNDTRSHTATEPPPTQSHDEHLRTRARGHDTTGFRGSSLERRLSDRYEPPAVARQPHALPLNPTLYRDQVNPATPDMGRRYPNRRPMREGHGDWKDPPGDIPPARSRDYDIVDSYDPSEDQLSRQPQKYRHSSSYAPVEDQGPESRMELDELQLARAQERDSRRRGGSLLDRMSLDNGPDMRGEIPPTQSLHDRVHVVPAKRDRNDMVGGEYMDRLEDEDEDDLASKKMRRKTTTKPRKIRRGPP